MTSTKILLVDDEQAITANLSPFLERAGFAVTVAADGEEALRQVGGSGPDLIVMDIEGSEFFALSGMPEILAKSRHLQMEYIADHLDKVSAVSNEELLGLLSPHFGCVRLQPDGDLVRRDDFLAFLDRLRADEISGDLLFSK